MKFLVTVGVAAGGRQDGLPLLVALPIDLDTRLSGR